MATSDEQRTYWAAEPESKKCVERFMKVRHRYLQLMMDTGRYDRVVSSYYAYRGFGTDGDGDTASTAPAGDHGEFVDVTTNDYAQLVQQGHIQLTQSPPSFKAVAANTDYASRTNAELADVLCEYYENVGEMAEAENECGRSALKSSEGWVVAGWDKTRGKDVAADLETQKKVKEGEPYFLHRALWDVVYDLDAGAPRNTDWFFFRVPMKRYDLAVTHPRCADQLLAQKEREGEPLEFPWRKSQRPESDYVWVWEGRHLPSPAVPKGRLLRFVDSDCVLFDSISAPGGAYEHLSLYPSAAGDNYATNTDSTKTAQLADFGYPYDDQLFAVSLTPERIEGELEPHTSYFDLLSLQEGIDTSISAMASAANNSGACNWQTKAGGDLSVKDFSGGFKVVETEFEIKRMENATVDEGAIKFGEACLSFMRRRVGFNDAALGDVTKGMPAQAMALLRAEAVQFHSNLQRAYYRLQAEVRTALIRLLRKFANTKRVAAIAGKSRSYQMKEFQAADLEGIERVTFEPLNPVMRTQAGRIGFADQLLAKGVITPRQYDTLVTTGRIDALWETETATLDSIEREKELLRTGIGLAPIQTQTNPDGTPALGPDGKPMPKVDPTGQPMPGAGQPGQQYVRPQAFDPHWLYIPEIASVLAMPDSRQNSKVVSATLDVIQMRYSLMMQMPWGMAALFGAPNWLVEHLQQAQSPMPMGPPPPPGGKPGAGGPPPPPKPPGSPDAGPGGVSSPDGGPPIRNVTQPKPPRNPLTGEQAPAPGAV